MSEKLNPYKQAIANREKVKPTEKDIPVDSNPVPAVTPQPKKRGRPATGKRSDEGWIGRTYYVQRSTDLDIEEELLNLKRQGVELDKSELADALFCAWIKWRKGENSDILLGEISPRRKS